MNHLDRRSFVAYASSALAALAGQWATPADTTAPTTGRGVGTALVTWLEDTSTALRRLPAEHRIHTHRLLVAHLDTSPTDRRR